MEQNPWRTAEDSNVKPKISFTTYAEIKQVTNENEENVDNS